MNPYEVLGVSPDASDDDVARAYKRLAKKYHPDLNPDNEEAARKMGEVNRAYDDIKAMRQRGESYQTYYNRQNRGADPGQTAYGSPFDPFGRVWHDQTAGSSTGRRRHSPVRTVIIVILVFYLVRVIAALLFGGFGSYGAAGGLVMPGGYDPGYGYYQTIP